MSQDKLLNKMIRICSHDPCWCGFKEQLDRMLQHENERAGFRSWTQEAHDRFISNADGHRREGL